MPLGAILLGPCISMLAARLFWWVWQSTRQFTRIPWPARLSTAPPILQFIKFDDPRVCTGLVVDCTHPHALQLTHHKGKQTLPPDLGNNCMSSTDCVMDAINCQHQILQGIQYVSTNHFDIDSFLSVFCVLNPEYARRHEPLLREVARVGDFRELLLSKSGDALEEDLGVKSLKVCCWMNTVERNQFYRPFGGQTKYETHKMDFFLASFPQFLENVEKAREDWLEEYDTVLRGLQQLHRPESIVQRFPEIGLVVISTPRPIHYYALFAPSRGYDVVLSMYEDQKYELELKYTTYVDITTRPVLPRISLAALTEVLNALEGCWQQGTSAADAGIALEHGQANQHSLVGCQWGAQRITDSGPILRLDREDQKLTKEERYGHPYERPIHPSNIPPTVLCEVVRSFFVYAYTCNGPPPCKLRWSWEDIHQYNGDIDWRPWMERAIGTAAWSSGQTSLKAGIT